MVGLNGEWADENTPLLYVVTQVITNHSGFGYQSDYCWIDNAGVNVIK